jgi:3-hydroxyacyl-CoA dehydrogenase
MEGRVSLKTQWEFTLDVRDTFLRLFNQYKTIDVPSFSYKQPNHAEERKLLKGYFDDKATVEEFDALVWRYHKENRKEFLDAVGKFDLLMGYFDLADAIGHLSFGVVDKMKTVYEELEDLAKEIKGSDDFILVISDHGMKAVGRYGDHTKKGFYSANHRLGLHLPRITDFYNIMRSNA